MSAVRHRSSIDRRKHRRPCQRAALFEMLEQRLAMTTGTFGIFSYEATAADVTITGCDVNAVVANIPAKINGLPVTSIGPAAFGLDPTADGFDFRFPGKLTTVTIPDSVVFIGAAAFANSPIQSITLPSGLKVIGDYAFYESSLPHISIPASVTTVGFMAFYGFAGYSIDVAPANPIYTSADGMLCSKTGWVISCPLKKTGTVSIPAGYKGIAVHAFELSSLDSVVIPEGMNWIGDDAFAGSVVKAITFPASVTGMGFDPFEGTSGARIGFVGAPPSLGEGSPGFFPASNAVVRYLAGNAAWAAYAGGKPFDGIPTTPVAVTAPSAVVAGVGDGKATLSWQASSASDGTAISDYVVQYSSDKGATWKVFADGVSSATTATVTGLVNGTSYVFRVAGKIDLGAGAFSANSASVTPGTFGMFKFTSNGASVTITGCDTKATVAKIPASINGVPVTAIAANAFNGCGSLTNIIVPSSVSSIGATPFVGCSKLVDLEFAGAPPTLAGGLASGNPTIVRHVQGDPTWSPYVGKELGGLPTQGVAPPAAPVAPTVVAGDRFVKITIPARAGGGAVAPGLILDYQLQYSGNGGKSWTTFSHLLPLSPLMAFTIQGLKNGGVYRFRVAATNIAGTGDYSSPTVAVPAALPGTPIGLTATKGDGKVTLSWLPASANGSAITQYRIQYAANVALGTWGPWITSNQPATIFNQAVITGLANGKTYRFRIAAVNAVGVSDYSAPWVNATPGA